MLKKLRIEVEESTAEECVEALSRYEHAIQQQEAKRFQYLWPPWADYDAVPIEDMPWKIGSAARQFYDEELGREVKEEVIEYDATAPGYKGRRVVEFTRVDTRHPVYSGDSEATARANEEAVQTLQRMIKTSR
jgi:hypothetical protein